MGAWDSLTNSGGAVAAKPVEAEVEQGEELAARLWLTRDATAVLQQWT